VLESVNCGSLRSARAHPTTSCSLRSMLMSLHLREHQLRLAEECAGAWERQLRLAEECAGASHYQLLIEEYADEAAH
jgi:hypothetical protein